MTFGDRSSGFDPLATLATLMDNTRWMTLFIDFDRGHRATDPRDLAAALERDTLAVKGEAGNGNTLACRRTRETSAQSEQK